MVDLDKNLFEKLLMQHCQAGVGWLGKKRPALIFLRLIFWCPNIFVSSLKNLIRLSEGEGQESIMH